MVKEGHRAVMLYLVQRMDCETCSVAHDIDQNYNDTLNKAIKNGVEILCYGCKLSSSEIILDKKISFITS